MKIINSLAVVILGLTLSAPVMAGSNANATATTTSTASQGNAQNITTNNEGSDLSDTVPGVIAPSLTTTLSETCMGSTSIGVAGAGFGISFGSTWKDDACVRRLDARELRSFGAGLSPNDAILFHFAAKERMCADSEVRAAFERVYAMTNRRDALCQATADEQAKAEAERAADQVSGVESSNSEVYYVEDQRTAEQVAQAEADAAWQRENNRK